MSGFYSRHHREETKGSIHNELKKIENHPLLKYGIRSYFEREWLDNALLVGMTPDEFWFGDPELYYNYERAYTEKIKNEQRNIWQIGARMCQALQSTLVYPAGVVDRNVIRQMPEYPEMPYGIEDSELSDDEVELERQKFIIKMENWVSSFKK